MPFDQTLPHEAAPYDTTVQESPSESEFQVKGLWRVLRSRILIIVVMGFLGAVLGYGVSKLTPTTYSSTATIELSKLSDTPLGVSNLVGLPQQFSSSDEMATIMLTEVAELQSSSIAFEVIDETGLAATRPYSDGLRPSAPTSANAASDERQKQLARNRMLSIFQSRLKVSLVKDTKLIEVSFTDSDPKRAAQVANAVIDVYTRLYAQARTSTAAKGSAWLANHLTEVRQQVLDSEKRVNDYEESTGIVGSPDQVNGGVGATNVVNPDSAVMEKFNDLNRELTRAQAILVAKEAVYRVTDTQNPDVILGMGANVANTTAGGAAVAGDNSDLNELSSLRQQRVEAAMQVAARVNTFGAKSPEMIRLQTQLKELDSQIQAELVHIHKHAENEYRLAQATVNGLKQLIAAQQHEVTRVNIGSNQLALLQQEANSKRALYQDLSAKLEQTSVSAGANASNITVVDPARPPDGPSGPKTGRNVLTGLVTGGLLGIFLAFLLDYLKDRPASLSGFARTSSAVSTLLLATGLWLFGATKPAQAQSFPAIQANIEQAGSTAGRGSLPQSSSLQSVPDDFSKATLEPGYLVSLSVYGVPEMAASLRVDANGNITVPLVGAIQVGGKSVTEAQADIAKALVAGDILKSPQVTLNVLQYTAGGVTVLGEVQTPGRLQLFGSKTLEEVIALAGGETTAASSTIEIQRQGQPLIYVRYSQGSSSEALRKFEVHNGDSIYVRRAGIVYVLGAVTRPGGYLMVNRGELNVLEAIALASGTSPIAKIGEFTLLRAQEDGSYKKLEVNYNDMTRGKVPLFALRVNDILFVPTSKLKATVVNGGSLIGIAAQAAIYRIP